MVKKGETFRNILVNNIRGYAVYEITDIVVKHIMDKFDAELLGVVSKTDPSAPENFRDDFESMLYESIDETLVVNDKKISFGIGDMSKLGYGGVTDPLSTMAYILEGILGEYAFIPASIIKKRFRNASYVGRWDKGYLVTKDSFFKKGWDKFTTWDKVRWGFSNTEPKDILGIDINQVTSILENTITKSVEEFSAKVRAEH
jgi:hypothetical protein